MQELENKLGTLKDVIDALKSDVLKIRVALFGDIEDLRNNRGLAYDLLSLESRLDELLTKLDKSNDTTRKIWFVIFSTILGEVIYRILHQTT